MATATNVPEVIDEKPSRLPILSGKSGLELRSLDDYWRFAQFVCKSGLAPKGMETPEACIIAMQIGAEIGLKHMQSIQSIAVINNRPSVWGDSVKGLILATGICEDFQEYFEGDGDKLVAHCKIKRRGMSWVHQTFSVADAKQADLTKKQGPWQQYPKRMLQMRARGFACRDAFPDALRGLYLAEEAMDMPEREPIDVTPTRSVRETVYIDPAQITSGEAPAPEESKATAENSPQPVSEIDERSALVAEVMQLLADVPAKELRDELISAARKETGAMNNNWAKWDTEAIQTLRNALVKE